MRSHIREFDMAIGSGEPTPREERAQREHMRRRNDRVLRGGRRAIRRVLHLADGRAGLMLATERPGAARPA